MRLFVAVRLPEELRREISRLQDNLRSMGGGIRWVKPAGIHCTLKFLGEVDTMMAKDIRDGLFKTPVVKHFRMDVKGLGVFPGWSRPRVIWTGIETNGTELKQLHGHVEKTLQSFGVPLDERPFRPHFTLGRVNRTEGLAALMDFCRDRRDTINLGSFQVNSFSLYESILKPEGAEYRVMGTYPLMGDD